MENEYIVEQTEKTKKLSGRKVGIIAAVIILIVAMGLFGISIYNSPENRLSRQLELGHKYLLEQDYVQAIVSFDMVIQIDEMNAEAYIGKSKAYIGLEDFDAAIKTLVTGYQATERNTDIMSFLVETYIDVVKNYEDMGDFDKAVEILEEAYTTTEENHEIRKRLIDDLLTIAKEKSEKGAFEQSLIVYDKILELTKDDQNVNAGLCACLKQYLDVLMKEERYKEIKTLSEKYSSFAKEVNFDKYLSKIAELERIKAENDALLRKVYGLMEKEDYVAMNEVDGSDEANTVAERLAEKYYLYFPDANVNMTGCGAGIYKFGVNGYYFYYGDYINGKREGNGTLYLKWGAGYYMYSGQWKGDKPNGLGIEKKQSHFSNNEEIYSSTAEGNLVDGLWDGKVNRQVVSYGFSFDDSFSAVMGVPTENRTKEFVSRFGNPGLEENDYIYSFDYNAGSGSWIYSKAGETEKIGIYTFTD